MNTVIVTGGSGGICSRLIHYICKGDNIPEEIWVLTRNRAFKPENIGNVRLIVIEEDLSTGKCPNLALELKKRKPCVSWLINGAGIGFCGKVEETPTEELENTVGVNCAALTSVTSVCLPYIKDEGRIVNFASAAAFCPQPGFAVYAASKAFVLSFSQALGKELEKRKISVSAICPGPVKTDFIKKMQKYSPTPKSKKKYCMNADRIARHAYKCAMRRKKVCVCGFRIKLARIAAKLLPDSLVMRFFNT